MENIASTHGVVTNVCAVAVDTEATVSTVSARTTRFYLNLKKMFLVPLAVNKFKILKVICIDKQMISTAI